MNMHDIRNENAEFDRVADLFTPRYPRKNDFSFSRPRRRLGRRTLWTVGSIAAMLVIVLTVGLKSVVPVSAVEVISTALDRLSNARSVKVGFVLSGSKGTGEEIYSPDMSGNMIDGTLYLLRRDGQVYTRIDWHDPEKNSIVFNGSVYIHFKDGQQVTRHSSSFGNELMELVNLNSLPEDLKKHAKFSSDGTTVTVTSRKGIITLCGEFRRDTRQLTKASAIATAPDGTKIIIMETRSIEMDVDLPDTLFAG